MHVPQVGPAVIQRPVTSSSAACGFVKQSLHHLLSGACVAAYAACRKLLEDRKVARLPIKQLVGAVSAGVVGGRPLLDLNYPEDRDAAVDMNLVMTEAGQYVEVQSSGEEAVFSPEELSSLLELGRKGIQQIIAAQRAVLGI